MLPFLDREDTNERLEILGLKFRDLDGTMILEDTPPGRKKFQALIELIAGAIADWNNIEAEDDMDRLNNELTEWAEEYLAG